MTTTIKGQPTSEQVRADLATQGRPILLAFSRGKDSIAAWLALRAAGIQVHAFYLYSVPGLLAFERDSLAYFEDVFGQRIHRYPHPSLHRQAAAPGVSAAGAAAGPQEGTNTAPDAREGQRRRPRRSGAGPGYVGSGRGPGRGQHRAQGGPGNARRVPADPL